ncbi:MAG: reprolysin-like metallopeptidase [Lysobacter sp.]
MQGNERFHSVRINEDLAIVAAAKGGFSVANPAGGSVFLRYREHRIETNGDLTWIGKTDTALGEQTVVLTFGPDAVFGAIPTFDGNELRIISENKNSYLVEIDRQASARDKRSTVNAIAVNDLIAAPSSLEKTRRGLQARDDQADRSAAAAAPTVDVFIAYTEGLRKRLGSASAVATRINHLVSLTNQAYVDSGVKGKIRLVGSGEVAYPDASFVPWTLVQLAATETGDAPASLAKIKGWRDAKKADLVNLLMNYDPAQKACGIAFTIGQKLAPIDADDASSGFSVVVDGGASNSSSCPERGLAHELGHNMGLVHDRDNVSRDINGKPTPGATAYSFGWRKDLPDNNSFATIMAIPTATQRQLMYFSSPSLLKCNGDPCGMANESDNVRTLNNTMSKIAAFK